MILTIVLDGTVEYLVKKSFFVITKDAARGLTDSWNLAYAFAVEMGYHYIMFTNNDVLVTEAGLKLLEADLRHEVLVVPLTSNRGAGHNIIQVRHFAN